MNEVLQLWGGGGHPAAAAASIKLGAVVDSEHVAKAAAAPSTPPAKRERPTDGPSVGGLTVSGHSSLKTLRDYVKEHGLDVRTAGKGRTKAHILADVKAAVESAGQQPAEPTAAPTASAEEPERAAGKLAEEVMEQAVAVVLGQIPEQVGPTISPPLLNPLNPALSLALRHRSAERESLLPSPPPQVLLPAPTDLLPSSH